MILEQCFHPLTWRIALFGSCAYCIEKVIEWAAILLDSTRLFGDITVNIQKELSSGWASN
jgi:hypothetical protein